MEEQFEALGMTVERFRATTPDTIGEDYPASLSLGKIDLSAPEIAISVSHFRVWRHMLAAGHPRVLVLEDDVRLSPLLPSFLAALDAEDTDIGLLRLETRMSEVLLHPRAEQAPLGISLHMPLSYEAGSGAYIISAAFASRLLASPKRFSLPLDDLLFARESPLRDIRRLRVAVPALAVVRPEISQEFDVPESILTSDAQVERDIRFMSRKRPKGLRKISREIRRFKSQIARSREAFWLRSQAKRTIVLLAGGDVTARR